MSTKELRSSLQSILIYLNHYSEFMNCHMVNYLTDNHWERFVPENIRECVGGVHNVDECIDEVFWKSVNSGKFADALKFFEDSKKYRLENMKHLVVSVKDLYNILEMDQNESLLTIREFMSEKKRHEVETTAELINDLMTFQRKIEGEDLYVVDAGDGKGYLSSRLALQYEHKVLGIDFNETNTENARERSKKLNRAWNGLTERAELQSQGVTPPRRGKKRKPIASLQPNAENYKTTNQFITTQLDFNGIFEELFSLTPGKNPYLCLTGLHTCGNLASTCLKVFTAQSNFRILCNIGCCYHLLKEEFSTDEFFGNKEIMDKQSETGFPISEFLKSQHVRIGRNARMLAAQSIHRTQYAKELPNKSLFYRALLEVLIVERDPGLKNTIQVGKVKKFIDFKDYVSLCCKKTNIGLENVSKEHLEQVELQHSEHAKFIELFYLLRMAFAPLLETLILLDRLLYLKENGFERSFLIPLFDPVISPRQFCIVSMK